MDLKPPTYLLWSLGEWNEAARSFWWFAAAATLTTFLVLNPSSERKQMKDKLRWAKNPGWRKSEHPSTSDRRDFGSEFSDYPGHDGELMRHGHQATTWDCRRDKKRHQRVVNARGEFCYAGDRGVERLWRLFVSQIDDTKFINYWLWNDECRRISLTDL